MKTIYRYRHTKPEDGHASFMLPDTATVLTFTEHWHSEKGWELLIDVLEDTREPKTRRSFFLCNAGDDLTALGDYPDVHFVGMHESKAYVSYLFETTHLSETERVQLVVQKGRYARRKPTYDEMSRTDRRFEDERKARESRAKAQTAPAAPAPVVPPVAEEAAS